jgi:hypothetical protein
MAVVYPYQKNATWVDGSGGGTPITAAKLNIYEDGIFNAHQQPAVRVTHNANQAILTTATFVTIAFNTERFDQAGGAASTQHDTVTNNSRLTCLYAGIYQITGQAQIESSNAGTTRALRIRLNGSTPIGQTQIVASAFPVAPADLVLNCTALYSLAVNDYVELQGYQDTGVTRNVFLAGNISPEFMMVRVG